MEDVNDAENSFKWRAALLEFSDIVLTQQI